METVSNTSPTGRFRRSHLAQAWLVLLLALSFGAALAAVQVNLSDTIAANKLNETLEKIPELLRNGNAAAGKPGEKRPLKITPGSMTVQIPGKTKSYTVYRARQEEELAGWVIKSGGQGYADKIELLIGLDPRGEMLTGLFVLEQKETPGLGNKITFPEWRSQFIQKKTAKPLVVRKGKSSTPEANAIDAITGATISSRAVTTIINRTIGDLKGPFASNAVPFIERQE